MLKLIVVNHDNNDISEANWLLNTEDTIKCVLKYMINILCEQGRVECVSLDGVQGVKVGETTCFISKPILRDNAQVNNHSRDTNQTFAHV